MAPKVAPKRKTRRNHSDAEEGNNTNISQEDLAQLVSDQIATAIPNIIAQLQSDATLNNNHDGDGDETGDGDGVNVGYGRKGCSYKNFVACKPLEFLVPKGW
jgi:hypothetical protein